MKEIRIVPPEGMEIDKENSTLECIKFKPVNNKAWRHLVRTIKGFYIGPSSQIIYTTCIHNVKENNNVFATEKQAKSALAMARISQIMENDERFGGVVTDEEWKNSYMSKYIITRFEDEIHTFDYSVVYYFLAFHTPEQRSLFLQENEDLIKDYLMLD